MLNMPATQQKEIKKSQFIIEMREGEMYPLFTSRCCGAFGIR